MFFRKKAQDAPSPSAPAPQTAATPVAPPPVEKAPAVPAAAPARAAPVPQTAAKAAAPQPPAAKPAGATAAVRAPAAPAPKVAASASKETAAPARPETDEERRDREQKARRGAVLSKRIAAAFGEIVSVLMRSKAHRDMPLAQLQTLVPAVVTGQYVTAEAQSRENGLTSPIAILLWASVSDEVDKRLASDPEQPLRLTAAEWNGGDNIWVVEAVGDNRAIGLLINRMHETRWKERPVKVRARSDDGKALVKTLTAPAKA
jgi:hemolysin-activating ACP:hemolysin acyltransferase